jgi:hypothetical protein
LGIEDPDPAVTIPDVGSEDAEVDFKASRDIRKALDSVDPDLDGNNPKKAADLVREVINSSQSQLCRTLARFELATRFSKTSPVWLGCKPIFKARGMISPHWLKNTGARMILIAKTTARMMVAPLLQGP